MSIVLSGYSINKPSAPSMVAGSVSGNLTDGQTYTYAVAFHTAFGKFIGTSANFTATSTGSVIIIVPTSSDKNITKRTIYRSSAGGGTLKILHSLTDSSITTYTDTKADGDLGDNLDTSFDSASTMRTINGYIKLAKPLVAPVETDITATGSAQADAYQLSSQYNIVSTTALNTGVLLPVHDDSIIGTSIKIRNNGANTLSIYPSTGASIDDSVANVAVSLATDTTMELLLDKSAHWVQL